ncbi:MAG: hypothetical protein CR968_05430 [Flavobacteriia bacterium]|nr:MAG: hypothetical protein CR968_05430 [Flavobacteriia bacterium]
MSLPANTERFISELNQHDLYPQLIRQINKDFSLTGVSMDLKEDCLPHDLINTVSESVYQLVQYNFDTFMQLLYRVDVSEQIMSRDSVDTAENITHKATLEIIKREWQKVQWRKKMG